MVDRLGTGISGIEPHQVVAAMPIHGAYAEFVCLPQRELVPVPSGLDPTEAVSVILNYITAYQMLYRSANVRSGQRVLISQRSRRGRLGTITAWKAGRVGNVRYLLIAGGVGRFRPGRDSN